MTNRFFQSQHLIFEVDTLDSNLSSHTNRRIYYIPPNANGTAGDISTVQYVAGTAVAGISGNSVNQGAEITLAFGVYVFWSESDNPSNKHCVSPAFEVLVEKRGTVRR